MPLQILVGPPDPRHFLRWEIGPDHEGGARLTLRCARCRAALHNLGYSWTSVHPGPLLGELLADMAKAERLYVGQECDADRR